MWGGQMSPGHLYMWISNGSYTHESFHSDNEYMIKWVFLDDSGWIIKWQGLDKSIIYGEKKLYWLEWACHTLCVRDWRNRLGLRGHDLSRPVWSAPNLVGAVSGIDAKGFQTFEFVHPKFFSGPPHSPQVKWLIPKIIMLAWLHALSGSRHPTLLTAACMWLRP